MKFRALLAITVILAISGCGDSNAIKGEFKSDTMMMGVKVASGKAVFSSSHIIANGNKIAVSEWAKENDVVIARDEKGMALAQLKIEENGDRLVQEIPMGRIIYTRMK